MMDMSDEEESGESVHFSDTSDADSPLPSVLCVEQVSEEDDVASVKSSSTNCSSVSRCKKRVMFQSGENLVLIREIPPRGFYSETDTDSTAESDEDSDDKFDGDESDEDDEENGNYSSEKCESKKSTAKGRYDVGKASGKTVVKVAHITGATIDNVKTENKKTTKKKVVKRSGAGKKSPMTAEADKTDTTAKAKQGTRVKSAKKLGSDRTDKNSNKTNVNNAKPKSKYEKRCKSAPPTLARPSRLNSSHTGEKVNGFYGISNMCASVMKPDNRPECVLSADETLWKLFDCSGTTDRDISAREKIIESSDFNYNVEVTKSESSRKASTSAYSNDSNNRRRPDVNAMSTTDRRLYSWLMANGNIPNPQQESPSIAPLWESSQTVLSDVVKAPT